ncbi:hypothetical protein FHG87_009570 [Trinorchestia longiramus]|nr:hypothetical protein FHG87_009570 [Trinorchestia longiramus]
MKNLINTHSEEVQVKEETHEKCIQTTWYIAVDFQLFLVAPIFLLPLKLISWKYVYTFSLVIVFSIVRGTIALGRDLIPVTLLDESNQEEATYDKYIANLPWARAAPYLVGSFCALLLLEVDDARKVVAAVGWMVVIATALSIVFGIVERNYFHFGPTHTYNNTERFFYSSFTSTAWAVCISWIIIMTYAGSGNGGPVGSILSHPLWVLPSRFTYSVYVICYPLQLMIYYSIHRLFFVSDLSFLLTYTAIAVVCFMVGIFVCLFGEAPYVNASKLFLPRLGFI